MDDSTKFILRAATTGTSTWYSIHHRIIFDPKKPPVFPGSAHQQLKTGVEDALYWANRGHCVYLAQGMFRNAGMRKPGLPYPTAIRQEPNLVACKNLYMDIDVKGEGYGSTNEALAALKQFHSESNLPLPTIIVGSGNGGLHVYWTMDTEFEPREFRRLAAKLVAAGNQHGLKFDQQCTMDAIRLLRVPGTWNFKGGEGVPGKPVTLMYMATDDIPLDVMTKALEGYKTAAPGTPRNSKSNAGGLNDDLTGGMEKTYPPASIDEVAKDCPFIAHTLETGGVDLVGEPAWHAMAGLSCYTDDPHKTVHRLCEKNSFYNFDATEEKLATAQRQREQRTLGPHKCSALSIYSSHCATCPNLALGTTPLLLPFRRPSYQGFQRTAKTPKLDFDLPEGYYRGGDNLIYFQKTADDGTNVETQAFEYQIIPGTASVEAGESYMLTFDTVQGERQVTMRVPCSAMAGLSTFMAAFYAIGMSITVKPPEVSRAFMAAYLKQLQSSKETLIRVPAFGWSQDHNEDWGFSYAGKFFSPAGEYLAGKAAEGVDIYRVQGDPAVWTGLANLVLTPDRPDLACLTASSFGAPLVYMTGENGFLLGLISTESGIGKTTALSLGQAIWAKPTLGGLVDTVNYTFAKCATLRHLPVIYDEIKGEKPTKAMVELVFQFTRGSEKGRSDRRGEMRAVREFETLCAYASNGSIVEAVRQVHQGTDADWLRMYEMQAIPLKRDDPDFTAKVKEGLLAIKINYGGIGMAYSQFLGRNQKRIARALLDYQTALAKELHADPQSERFWLGAMACIIFGAYLANSQGYCTFPIEEMRAYLINEYHRMRAALASNPSDIGTDIALVGIMGIFISDKMPRNLIVLDKTWPKSGRPPKGYATIKNDKTDNAWGPLEVQMSGDPLTVKISDSALRDWCLKTGRPKSAICDQLKRRVNAKLLMTSIGTGTHRAGGRQHAWVFETQGTILEDLFETAHYKLLPP